MPEGPQSYRSGSSNGFGSNISGSSFQYTRTKRENSMSVELNTHDSILRDFTLISVCVV